MIRVWMDASHEDPALRRDSAAALDWGRRRVARLLRHRRFGDADMDAVVTIALLGCYGARERPRSTTEAAGRIIERGLQGL
jgi:hypothetical protein